MSQDGNQPVQPPCTWGDALLAASLFAIDPVGTGYSRADNFKRDFAREIADLKEVFPKLPVALSDDGFSISPGTAEILAIPTKYRK